MEVLTADALTADEIAERVNVPLLRIVELMEKLTRSRTGRPVEDFGVQLPPYGQGKYGTAYTLTGTGWDAFRRPDIWRGQAQLP
jgi:hypothetical protein